MRGNQSFEVPRGNGDGVCPKSGDEMRKDQNKEREKESKVEPREENDIIKNDQGGRRKR